MNIEGGRGQWQISDPAAAAEDKDWAAQCVTRVSALVLKKLRHRPMTNRDLTGSIASRDRRWLKSALHALSGSGQIEWMEWRKPALRSAGYEMVELPKPVQGPDGEGEHSWVTILGTVSTGNGRVWGEDCEMDPDWARELAAALLAAAVAAEADQ